MNTPATWSTGIRGEEESLEGRSLSKAGAR